MVIETIEGTDFYNYKINEAPILDRQSAINLQKMQDSTKDAKHPDYATLLRQRKRYGKCKRFRHFLYNKQNRTSCNRTGKHWGSLIFYYAFFLGILLICFMCYFYGINRSVVSGHHNLPPLAKFYTSKTPTFTFVPIKVNEYQVPFIWYKFSGSDLETNRRSTLYVQAIRDFFKSQATICAKKKLHVCPVRPQLFGPCGEDTFGWDEQEPCLYIKLNSRSGWRPDAYHSKDRVQPSMPSELYEILDESRETMCIWCGGTTAFDRQHIGTIEYFPEPCFNDSYFPFAESVLNVNPTIAIQLSAKKTGYIFSITCRLFGLDAGGTGEAQQSVSIYIGEHNISNNDLSTV